MEGRPEPMAQVKGSSSSGNTDAILPEGPQYMAAQPKVSNYFTAFASLVRHGQPTKIEAVPEENRETTWQQKISLTLVNILWRLNKCLKLLGFVVEWSLNLLNLNGGPFGFLYRLLLFKWGEIIWPQPDSENYLSIIGLVDPRATLMFVDTSEAGTLETSRADPGIFPAEDVGSRSTANVCVMAAKLAYENPAVVKNVVNESMGMHFVNFHNCWNEYQQMENTQAFVFIDKPTDANAVVVAFRGTEPFNGYDWSTDLDFSWVKLPELGGVHIGFLEALGLGTCDSIETFVQMWQNANAAKAKTQLKESQEAAVALPNTPKSLHHETEIMATPAASGLAQEMMNIEEKVLAYDDITKKVSMLLHDNPAAKLFITGHSLGGALAVIYSAMLHFMGEMEVVNKIAAVYTFGQPRVGDEEFANYAKRVLHEKYVRVVYCNDVVSRVPFDNQRFLFRHIGNCAYFNSVYGGLTLREEPNRNFFCLGRLLPMRLNALWEVVQGAFLMPLLHGDGFLETKMSLLIRLMGLVLPGVASHSPTNYVNSVRLGPLPLQKRHDNLKDIAYVVFQELPKVRWRRVVTFAAEEFFRFIIFYSIYIIFIFILLFLLFLNYFLCLFFHFFIFYFKIFFGFS